MTRPMRIGSAARAACGSTRASTAAVARSFIFPSPCSAAGATQPGCFIPNSFKPKLTGRGCQGRGRVEEITMSYDSAAIRELVKPDRIHRDIYIDPELFELEMERIFGCAWIYVGHDSQVAKPGDYIATTLGRQPVVMSRHGDGIVH